MAIIERDERLLILLPKDSSRADVEHCHEQMVRHGWPADRVVVMCGPEGFAVLKAQAGATQERTP